jgi:multidrug transporter EmrE-like cation transporter
MLALLFAAAAVLCWSVILVRLKRRTSPAPQRSDLVLGALLGIPNFFSSWFLIRGLQDVPASTAFPLVSASGVVLATVAAVLIWRESPNRLSWIGISLALISVTCLGAGS